MPIQPGQQDSSLDWEHLYGLFKQIAAAQLKTERLMEEQSRKWNRKFEQFRKETERRRKEFEKEQHRWREETEQRQKEAEQRQKEAEQRRKDEAEQRQKEAEQRRKEFEKEQRGWKEEAEQRQKEAEQRRKETEEEDRKRKLEEEERERRYENRFKKLENFFTSQWGRLVESLVEGDLVPVLNARGIDVNHTTTRMGGREFEFDILAINGQEMVIVEVKTTLRPKDVKRFLKQLDKAKTYMPQFANHIIYGAMAWLKADSEAEKMAEKRGLFVIRATGNSASILNDKKFAPRSW
uniref:DUF8196 domain-containing protein n=1 Tax=Candidatus Kentrum sp. MB TaxID=2138164 RepID=A0A450XGV6_9GAMM|nr:MAG: hypothetical protein BECKMB1821G_GA0114241_103811 [Candidatus Kentron sp. MB]